MLLKTNIFEGINPILEEELSRISSIPMKFKIYLWFIVTGAGEVGLMEPRPGLFIGDIIGIVACGIETGVLLFKVKGPELI